MKRSAPDLFAPAARKVRAIPFDFVLEELAGLEVRTSAMFGSTAVYVREEVVFILRQKGDADDGVWVAYEPSREAEALAALPSLTPIDRFPSSRCWKKLGAKTPTFEEDVVRACRVVRDGGPLGKIPVRQAKKSLTPPGVIAKKAAKRKGGR